MIILEYLVQMYHFNNPLLFWFSFNECDGICLFNLLNGFLPFIQIDILYCILIYIFFLTWFIKSPSPRVYYSLFLCWRENMIIPSIISTERERDRCNLNRTKLFQVVERVSGGRVLYLKHETQRNANWFLSLNVRTKFK